MWPVEKIPIKSRLFYRIHETWIDEGEVNPGVFQQRGEETEKGMSTDWEKYSTPQQSRLRCKNPQKNGVINFITKDLRGLQLEVIHSPFIINEPIKKKPWIKSNRAHTNVKGDVENVKIRLQLLDLFKWEIQPSTPLN